VASVVVLGALDTKGREVEFLARLIGARGHETLTVDTGVLGTPLVATIGTEAFRHYFFDVGHGATVAFFEYRDYPIDRFAKPAGVPDGRAEATCS